MKSLLHILLVTMLTGVLPSAPAWAQGPSRAAAAAPDTTQEVRHGRWGPIAAPADSNSARFADRPRPGWEKAALVPYHVVGLPFRGLDYLAHQGFVLADRLGLFGFPPAEHPGLPLPLGVYLMPEFGISGLEGTSLGVNLTRYGFLGPGNRVHLVLESSTRHANKTALGTLFQLDPKSSLQLGIGYSACPVTRYYGLGPTSLRENESYYRRRSWWAGFEGDRSLGGNLSLEFRGFWSRVKAGRSRFEVDRALDDIHAGNLPPGYPGESKGLTWRVGILHDSTEQDGRPESGSFHRASVGWFHATDGSDVSYRIYNVDFLRFVPLWHTKRVLGLRAFFNRIDKRDGDEVPLTRLVTFSEPDELRGLSSLRFYGLGSLGINTEYRWPVWVVRGREGPGVDAYLFGDVGQTYMEFADIATENLEWNGGFGLRVIGSGRSFLASVEVGFSDEETVVNLKFSQNFQYDTRGMYGGSDPTLRR